MVSPENSSVFITAAGRRGPAHAGCAIKPRMIPYTLGFTIIEVLVTLIILSIAMLGMAHMQVLALRSDTESNARSQARILTGQLAEQLRSTREVVEGEQTADTSSTTDANCLTASGLQDYVNCFQHHAAERLPGGATVVEGDTTDSTYTLTARWTSPIEMGDCPGTPDAPQGDRYWDGANCITQFTQEIRIHPHGRGGGG